MYLKHLTGNSPVKCSHQAPGGALAWRLPAISEVPAAGLGELEESCYLIENLLYLCGWIADIKCVTTFHERFWARVRRSKRPAPGNRPMTVEEVRHALGLFQSQWAKASRAVDKLDETILVSLPRSFAPPAMPWRPG